MTNITQVKPEDKSFTDKRRAESDFSQALELARSRNVANNAKAMKLNRKQMFKNAPLEDSYEPKVTTKLVSSPMPHEVDLPALKQSFKNTLGRNVKNEERLNIITHSNAPKYQSYVTAENDKGMLSTMPQKNTFRRRSMLSKFVEMDASPKNHKEFHQAQKKQPVGLYGFHMGAFNFEAAGRTKYNSFTRSQMSS